MLELNFADNYYYADKIQDFLYKEYIPESWLFILRDFISLGALFFICFVSYFVTKAIIRYVGKRLIKKTSTIWDDRLFANKFFKRLSYLVPAILIIRFLPFAIPYYEGWISFGIALTKIYITLIMLLTVFSFLSTFNDVYDTWTVAKYKPIKGYIQLVKVILSCIVVILIIAIIFNQSPLYLLTGLGALSAVLLLIFKDALLGLVAGIQLSANDMARPGDWITMPKYNADGDVEDISLTTVKVRNFDKTLVYIPSYALISDSFINWRGMLEAEGRRIKRAISIDISSVKFCSSETLEKLQKIELVKEYIINKQQEIDEYNRQSGADTKLSANGRRQTNLGIFRAYMEAFLKSLPEINQDTLLMVRQLPPSDKGISLEVYAFSVSKDWIVYEQVQADIFDHLIAVLPEFDLKLFQTPTGNDLQVFAGNTPSSTDR